MVDDDPDDEEPALELPNAAEPAEIRKAQDKSKRAKDNAKEFWRRVMGDPVGRQEMWRMLQDLGTFEDTFACGPNGFPQSEATWFKAGQKSFGQRLYQTLGLMDRENLFLMHDEQDSRFAKPKPKRRSPERDS